MGRGYEINVSIIPVCTSCGEDLFVGYTLSESTGDPFKIGNPLSRTDRKVFIGACKKCFQHKGEIEREFVQVPVEVYKSIRETVVTSPRALQDHVFEFLKSRGEELP